MLKIIVYSLMLLVSFAANAQREIRTNKTDNIMNIDGRLDEADWENAETVSDFTQITPNTGAPATEQTSVKVLYDDEALYIGAHCYGSPEVISKVFSQRDLYNSNTDYFSVMIDTYKDRLNGFVFSVSTLGVQYDAKIYAGDYNSKLDMIWYGEIHHSDSGYTVEMKIPYSAIRFAPNDEQEWGINFTRYHTLNREESTWNPVKPDLDNVVAQGGTLKNLHDIYPPVRLFFSPYFSAYADHQPTYSDEIDDWTNSINGGMDIKYGVNEAYTLDMTLIPDFGQVVTDNVVLNLTPFEVFFQENRPFFNEGTELFEKTGHFYTRRVGGRPINRWRVNSGHPNNVLEQNEAVITNPYFSQLINASKLSGRGKNGLGIGLFNGISAPLISIVEDTVTGEQREIETNPLTNYNVAVFDQNLKNNSSVTLTNTSAWRSGHTYDANLTAVAAQFNTQDNVYFTRGDFALSQKYHSSGNEFGHSVSAGAGKQSGNFVFNANYIEQSDTYDPNDMGFLLFPNKRNVNTSVSYNIYKPFWKLNRFWSSFSNNYERLYNPNVFTNASYWLSSGIQTKRFHSAGVNIGGLYTESYDYFEPRENMNFFFIRPVNFTTSGWISSNYQKPFALDLNFNYTNHDFEGWHDLGFAISPRVRLGNRAFLVYRFEEQRNINQLGYAIPFNDPDRIQPEGYDPIFGRRDVLTTINTIDLTMALTNKAGFTFRLRHYWSRVQTKNFYELQENGRLTNVNLTAEERLNESGEPVFNTSFNAFSIDLVYRWIFSPASEISIVWKNNIFTEDSDAFVAFNQNLNQTLRTDQLNSFSIRLVYFVDYLDIRGFLNKRNKLIN